MMAELVPTNEQETCITMAESNEELKICALAGTGKTSTLVLIAKKLKMTSLYLAFNKSMASEAREKFPDHVECRTVHSLAFGTFGQKYSHKLSRPIGKYVNVAGTGSEIARYFNIGPIEVDKDTLILSNFIGLIVKETLAKYEQSADEHLDITKHIPKYQINTVKRKFGEAAVVKLQKVVAANAKKLWKERITPTSKAMCTHDTYLKLYQLSKPDLSHYKVIYADEQQDVNDCILDILVSQQGKSKLIAVGDERQAIYGWRGGVNAMKKLKWPETTLSKSFRYGQDIADIAKVVLQGSVKLVGNEYVYSRVGLVDGVDYDQPYTILFRKNATLVMKAIELLEEGEKVNVNIDVKDFVAMLRSSLELYHGNLNKVKHEDIVPFGSWKELLEEVKYVPELGRMVKIILAGDAENVIDMLHKYRKSPNAKITLTTSHKAKGLEYDQVVLADDFPSAYNKDGEFIGLTEEEENLLYVACTRAKNRLQINGTVMELLYIYGDRDPYDFLVEDDPHTGGITLEINDISRITGECGLAEYEEHLLDFHKASENGRRAMDDFLNPEIEGTGPEFLGVYDDMPNLRRK